MIISPKGIIEIASHEGIVLGPYKDSVGVWTYGIGHTKGAGDPDPALMSHEDTRGWSESQVNSELRVILKVFSQDLRKFEDRVNSAIGVQLEQHQFDALVSFDYNTGGIFKAQLTKAINGGNFDGMGFMGWLKPPEIKGRRQKERALFLTGQYSATQIPIYDATGDGRLSRRGVLTAGRLLSLMGDTPKPHSPAPEAATGDFWAILAGIIGRIVAAIFNPKGKPK